ncbi:hypothetical protein JCM21900_000059 [Sporobolomyces salmonicolor]
MAASFIGLPVLIQLRSGGTASGTVAAIGALEGTITLADARVSVQGAVRLERTVVLRREEVAGLELLSVNKAEALPPTAPPAPRVSVQPGRAGLEPWQADVQGGLNRIAQNLEEDAQALRGEAAHGRLTGPRPYIPSPLPSPSPASCSPGPSTPCTGKRGTKGGRRKKDDFDYQDVGGDVADLSASYNRHGRRRQPPHSAAHESFDEDFDFGAGLRSFDKQAVFAKIRSQDETDPSLRLHAHNRNPARTPQTKLLPTESVLTVEELEAQQLGQLQFVAGSSGPRGVTTDEDSELDGGYTGVGSRQVTNGLDALSLSGKKGLVTESGISLPTMRLRQWKEALSIADIETAPSSFQRTELSAYQLVTFVLSHLSSKLDFFPTSSSSSPPHSRPSVLLLCTDCEKANVALRSGTLLANRGFRVVALVEDAKSEELRTNLRVFSSAGGRIVRDLADITPTYNLVIDALADSESNTGASLSSSVSGPGALAGGRPSFAPSAFSIEVARWANSLDNGAIVVSIDVPFGVDHDTGTPLLPELLAPAFIFSRALPRPGAAALSSSSPSPPQIFVADVGFPPSIWDRIGVDGYDSACWGAESVLRVELN